MNEREILDERYQAATDVLKDETDLEWSLPQDFRNDIDYVISNLSIGKATLSVLLTLITRKITDPDQDIRYHQAQLPGGFSGRTIDANNVTPFLKEESFPAMAESGWLTRNYEQSLPYDFNYPYKATNQRAKEMGQSFLRIVDGIQNKGYDAEETLLYFMLLLIKDRDSKDIELAKPHNLSIQTIISHLEKHFSHTYNSFGASRLPVLAIYAAYQCMMSQVARYEGKILPPIQSHNAADMRSGSIGDIEVLNEDDSAFEGVEVKHMIKVTPDIVRTAYSKFMVYQTDRYYILTTANMDSADWEAINREIDNISQWHGCQVIVNGVYSTLKYYLRLLKDPSEFIDRYVELLKADTTIKFEHKEFWNEIVAGRV